MSALVYERVGYVGYCPRVDCDWESPALRETREQAEEDGRAHDSIVHEHE